MWVTIYVPTAARLSHWSSHSLITLHEYRLGDDWHTLFDIRQKQNAWYRPLW